MKEETKDKARELEFNFQNALLEIERLKELCNKYEEEHNTTFKVWQDSLLELEELREYKKNATKKHWQQKSVEHYIKERLYEARIKKAIEYIGNKNLGIPRKTSDKFIKILQGKDNE